uniref:Uncharacterized protein n=1 Tax=Oryza punctata TaxID=4537 RepID=A0A0E0KA07_ORYPU
MHVACFVSVSMTMPPPEPINSNRSICSSSSHLQQLPLPQWRGERSETRGFLSSRVQREAHPIHPRVPKNRIAIGHTCDAYTRGILARSQPLVRSSSSRASVTSPSRDSPVQDAPGQTPGVEVDETTRAWLALKPARGEEFAQTLH